MTCNDERDGTGRTLGVGEDRFESVAREVSLPSCAMTDCPCARDLEAGFWFLHTTAPMISHDATWEPR